MDAETRDPEYLDHLRRITEQASPLTEDQRRFLAATGFFRPRRSPR